MAAVDCVVQDSVIAMMISDGYGMLPEPEPESIVATPVEGEISQKSGFRASFFRIEPAALGVALQSTEQKK